MCAFHWSAPPAWPASVAMLERSMVMSALWLELSVTPSAEKCSGPIGPTVSERSMWNFALCVPTVFVAALATDWRALPAPPPHAAVSDAAAARAQMMSPRLISVLPLFRLPFRHPDILVRQHGRVVHPAGDRVLQEMLVVPRGKIMRTGVRTAALLAREPRLHHAPRGVEHVAEFDRLRQVAVEDVALVL